MTILMTKTYKDGSQGKATMGQLSQKNVNFLITLASERFNDPNDIDHEPSLAGGVERIEIEVRP